MHHSAIRIVAMTAALAGALATTASAQTAGTEPDPDVYVEGAVEPTFDYEELQKLIVYPEEARKAGLDGKVVVRVLVDEKGIPTKYRIDLSGGELFDRAAVAAVMALRMTPGTRDGVPIKTWISIPFIFRLN